MRNESKEVDKPMGKLIHVVMCVKEKIKASIASPGVVGDRIASLPMRTSRNL